MTKLGQELITILTEKMHKPLQSTTAAGFFANQKDNVLKDNLGNYFRNIICDPERTWDYIFFKNSMQYGPDEKPWEDLGISHTKDLSIDNNGIQFDSNFKMDGVLDTQEKYDHFVSSNLKRIAQEIEENFNDFISECLKPENFAPLLKLITLTEGISQVNNRQLQSLNNFLLNDEAGEGELSRFMDKNSNGKITQKQFDELINIFEEQPENLDNSLKILEIIYENFMLQPKDLDKSKLLTKVFNKVREIWPIAEALENQIQKRNFDKLPLFKKFLDLLALKETEQIDVAKDFFGASKEELLEPNNNSKTRPH